MQLWDGGQLYWVRDTLGRRRQAACLRERAHVFSGKKYTKKVALVRGALQEPSVLSDTKGCVPGTLMTEECPPGHSRNRIPPRLRQ